MHTDSLGWSPGLGLRGTSCVSERTLRLVDISAVVIMTDGSMQEDIFQASEFSPLVSLSLHVSHADERSAQEEESLSEPFRA